MKKHILLIGGDHRTPYVAKRLQKHFAISLYGMETYPSLPIDLNITNQLVTADMILLPIPMTQDGKMVYAPYATNGIPLQTIFSKYENKTLLAGNIPTPVIEQLKQHNISYFDYGKAAEFPLKNALPTAEGTIEIIMKNTPYVMEGKSVCVVGYGRIGKVLSKKLKALGCHVTATARRTEQLEEIKVNGYQPLYTQDIFSMPGFDIIINTVPSLVIDQAVINNQKNDVLIIDLASKPGGVDFDYAKRKGIKTIHALSLPAKHAPETAGTIIADTIFEFLDETE